MSSTPNKKNGVSPQRPASGYGLPFCGIAAFCALFLSFAMTAFSGIAAGNAGNAGLTLDAFCCYLGAGVLISAAELLRKKLSFSGVLPRLVHFLVSDVVFLLMTAVSAARIQLKTPAGFFTTMLIGAVFYFAGYGILLLLSLAFRALPSSVVRCAEMGISLTAAVAFVFLVFTSVYAGVRQISNIGMHLLQLLLFLLFSLLIAALFRISRPLHAALRELLLLAVFLCGFGISVILCDRNGILPLTSDEERFTAFAVSALIFLAVTLPYLILEERKRRKKNRQKKENDTPYRNLFD